MGLYPEGPITGRAYNRDFMLYQMAILLSPKSNPPSRVNSVRYVLFY